MTAVPTQATNDETEDWRYFWSMLSVVALPMLLVYFFDLWSREAHRFFPFVFLAVGWLVHRRWDRQFNPPCGSFGWVLVGLGFVFIALAAIIGSPWLSALGFVSFCFALFASSRGEDDESLIGLAIPLLMLLTLPLGYDELLILRLQVAASSLCGILMNTLGIPFGMSDHVILLSQSEVSVAAACGGVASVYSLMFLATLLIAVRRRPLWLTPMYLLFAILLAVLANLLRLAVAVLGQAWFSTDLAVGWAYGLVALIAFVLSALPLLSFDRLMVTLFHPVEPSAVFDGEGNLLIRFWNFMVGAGETHSDKGIGPIVWLIAQAPRKGADLWHQTWSRRSLVALAVVLTIASVGQAIYLARPANPDSRELASQSASANRIHMHPFNKITCRAT